MAEMLKFIIIIIIVIIITIINWFNPLCAVVVNYKYHCFIQKL